MAKPTYEFSGGIAPSDYSPNSYEELGGAIGKVAEQVIRGVVANDKLAIFDKTPVENGDTIEQIVIKLANARAYDETGAGALSRKTPNLVVKMFSNWTKATYDTTVEIMDLKKILTTGKGVGGVSSKIVASLTEGEKHEKYCKTKDLLQWARQDKDGKILKLIETVDYGSGKIDYEGVLTALKDTISGMQYVNADYNTADLERATDAKDIVILMPYKLKNRLDVESLAGVFNLEKAEVKSRIIEIDTKTEVIDGKATYPIYILDRNAILSYKRFYEVLSQLNADGAFWNYFLHTERMYAISPLFDCGYILVKAE